MPALSHLLILAVCLAVLTAGRAQASAASQASHAVQMPDADLHAIALAHLEPARTGALESQWVLQVVLDECAPHLRRYPTAEDLRTQERTPAPAYARGYERLLERRSHLLRITESRCTGFRADPIERFGMPADWFALTIAARHPAALLEQTTRTARTLRGGAFPAELRKTLEDALRSGRPDVLWAFALWDLERALGLPERRVRNIQPTAWLLLACQRGFPCAAGSHWITLSNLAGTRPDARTWLADWVPAAHLAAAEAEALRLGESIDAGRWDVVLAGLYL